MIEKLSAGMKSWIIQDYRDICDNPTEYGIADVQADYAKVLDIIVEDVNAKFETRIPRTLIEDCVNYPDKIIGVTPILFTVKDGDIDRPATRGEEIDAYLKAHPCDKYVILDDCPEMLRYQWPHQVLVNDEFGLTDADVEKAIKILDASAIK